MGPFPPFRNDTPPVRRLIIPVRVRRLGMCVVNKSIDKTFLLCQYRDTQKSGAIFGGWQMNDAFYEYISPEPIIIGTFPTRENPTKTFYITVAHIGLGFKLFLGVNV